MCGDSLSEENLHNHSMYDLHIPSELLSDARSSRCPDKESCIYHLIGVVEHSGSMRGGHYVAYVRGPRDEKMQEVNDEDDPNQSTWYCISDSSVRKISFSEVLQREAYLLFYEKDVL
ncbi:hypothetical protein SUGI_0662780 [Cryptomeria japonica]|nr:hypothetical protein SUGI_0662780 [Cryptomeria japonica]